MENNYENGFNPNEAQQQPAWNQQPTSQQPASQQPAWDQPVSNDFASKAKKASGNILDTIKALPKKVWLAVGAGVAALVALIAVILVVSALNNTYKTPIKSVEKVLNMTSAKKMIDYAPQLLNGFGEKEAKQILKIAKKSDQWDDLMDEADEGIEYLVEMLEDEYGSNYKIKIKIEDKEKIDKDELKEFRNQLRDLAEFSEELDDMDSDDYEDMADEMGISKSQAKDLVKNLKSLCKKCKSAKVSKGYELEVVVTIDGKDADEPMEQELTINVYKVDGRWILDVFSLIGMAGLGGFGF